MRRAVPELLAPAGGPEAGLAALEYGADAVYLGLSAFSARAEAENFSPEELSRLVARAHAMTPARRVYVAVNTLVGPDGEFTRALETVADAALAGADALIIQDLGLAARAARHFPGLARHASTQLAIHNADGARTAADWGFSRVTLAREMTPPEIARAAVAGRGRGVAVEAFVHGALCYGYSGLCLAGGVLRGRSGNRGRCPYPCREFCEIIEDENASAKANSACRDGHAFSLKDMGRIAGLEALLGAGVDSLKIEGRKKSPLYVAVAVRLYRRLLDAWAARPPNADDSGAGHIGKNENSARADAWPAWAPRELTAVADDLRTVFARPWTPFFLDGPTQGKNADPEVTGHRGAPCGVVREARPARGGPLARGRKAPPPTPARAMGVVFKSGRALERHDGLQIDLPGEARPFGFAVDELRIVHERHDERVYEAPEGASVWVALPAGAPAVAPGAPVYCSSSQSVKRRYPMPGDSPASVKTRFPLDVAARLDAAAVYVFARLRVTPRAEPPPTEEGMVPAPDDPAVYEAGSAAIGDAYGDQRVLALRFPAATDFARDAAATDAAGRKAFSRLGDSRFALAAWRCDNPDGRFVSPAQWNACRRAVVEAAEKALDDWKSAHTMPVFMEWSDDGGGNGGADDVDAGSAKTLSAVVDVEMNRPEEGAPRWSVFADHPAWLDEFADEDWRGVDEIIISLEAPASASAFACPGAIRHDGDNGHNGDAAFLERIAALAARAGEGSQRRPRLRLALPAVLRDVDAPRLRRRFAAARAAGWNRWLLANPWAFAWFDADGSGGVGNPDARAAADLAVDWPLYTVNEETARFWRELGVRRFTLSPEADGAEARELALALAAGEKFSGKPWGSCWRVVYGDTPLFQSAVCAHHALARAEKGRCPYGPGGRPAADRRDADGRPGPCRAEAMALRMAGGADILVLPQSCGTVAVPLRAATDFPDAPASARGGPWLWRADFRWRPYTPDTVRSVWRRLRRR